MAMAFALLQGPAAFAKLSSHGLLHFAEPKGKVAAAAKQASDYLRGSALSRARAIPESARGGSILHICWPGNARSYQPSGLLAGGGEVRMKASRSLGFLVSLGLILLFGSRNLTWAQ